jgi:hypothetical protein
MLIFSSSPGFESESFKLFDIFINLVLMGYLGDSSNDGPYLPEEVLSLKGLNFSDDKGQSSNPAQSEPVSAEPVVQPPVEERKPAEKKLVKPKWLKM